jgi:lipid II:glycine glycyltransferase (peptidoglycan interpeptide bridge formation enzyme)
MPVSPETVALFYGLMQDTARRNAFAVHALDYYGDFLDVFGDDALLLGAWNDEGTLSAMLIAAVFGSEGIYMYGASSTTHRAHGAGAALQFEAMKWARDRGAATYDLWGIPAQDPESVADADASQIAGTRGEDWRGLYRFKTGFGGTIVSYPPTLERRYVPLLPGIARHVGVIAG